VSEVLIVWLVLGTLALWGFLVLLAIAETTVKVAYRLFRWLGL